MRVDVENPNPGANASVSTTGTAVPTSATLVGGSDGTNLVAVKVGATGNVQADVVSSALPTGAATSANQTNGSQKTQVVNGSGNAVSVNQLSNQVVSTDYGLVTNAVLHGLTTGGGGGYVDVKVNPSGSLVVDASGSSVTVSGTVAATQSGTWGVGLNAGTNLVGKVGIDQTTPGTTNAVSLAQVGSTTVATGNGVVGTGVQRVAIASDNTAFTVNAAQSGTWGVGLNAGSNLVGKVGIDQTTPGTTNGVQVNAALPAGSNLIGKVGLDQTTPGTTNAISLAQVGSTTVATGNGVVGTGVQRVAIASDNTAFSVNAVQSGTWNIGTLTSITNAVTVTGTVAATQSGTWTVQPGNTANTTAWLVTQGGRTQANAPVYNDYSSANVTTSAYTQLVASTTSAVSEVEIFDSSGQGMILATGGAGSETDQIYIFPGGNGRVPLKIAASTRVSIKAKTASATSGYIMVNFYA